ncbi:AAA family ATPase [Undibacterium oligocarboniphilum]|uniref:AAA family ATPase n=1 Tax=Undibacterium oligocarboniphilum TaxID=666702 RepID=A0A850QQA5_9BURK|nr:AAA family ATPase [Undibacterium oligocarboniphilum]MBC3871927.1 AAA family ATPase [Undibacterium oligocarboniphilum]NVO79523.1 AAA family ATPase [Undibacterium oligocarboniphilum]
MHITKVSLQNFGPFADSNFQFSGNKINIVTGNNASGKTQLCGAIIAAIVGRSAIHIAEQGIGPSLASATLVSGTSEEETILRVSNDSRIEVTHTPSPLAINVLAAINDFNSPLFLITKDLHTRRLAKFDLRSDTQHLPDNIKSHELWSNLRNIVLANPNMGSGGEQMIAALLRELVVRKKSGLALPLLIDEFELSRDDGVRDFTMEILTEIAKLSQVILFSHQKDLLPQQINRIELFRPDHHIRSLAGYNYQLFSPRNIVRTRSDPLKLIKGAKFPYHENRGCELKEVKGSNPLSSIKALVDQYAVAFLNAGVPQKGSIFWGVRDEDRRIVGVTLTESECEGRP